jgi:hypothetical protein
MLGNLPENRVLQTVVHESTGVLAGRELAGYVLINELYYDEHRLHSVPSSSAGPVSNVLRL